MILLVLGASEQVSFFAQLLLVRRLIVLGDFPLWRKHHADTEDIPSKPTEPRISWKHLLDWQVVSSCFP